MNSKLRIAGWLAVGGLLAAAFVSPSVALASKPQQHKVTICHATPPDTAANGWQRLSVDVSSSGHLQGGHDTQHNADIIPPYSYYGYNYPGKNWDAAGQAVYNNNCVKPATTTTTTSTSTSTSSTGSETTSSSTSTDTSSTTSTETTSSTTSTETSSTDTTATTTDTSTETSSTDTSATSTGDETTTSTTSHHTSTTAKGGDPTLPPTDTIGSSDGSSSGPNSMSLLLIVAAGLLAMVLVLTPATKARRR